MMSQGITLTNVPDDEKYDSTYDFDSTCVTRGGSRPGSVHPSMSRVGSIPSRGQNSVLLMDRRPMTMQSSMGLSNMRPWTSVGGSDAVSVATMSMSGNTFDPLNATSSHINSVVREKSPREIAGEQELQINKHIDETVLLKSNSKKIEALDKAKEAGKKEQLLRKYKKAHSLPRDNDLALTFATWFNLARAYEANDMMDEAIESYNFLANQRKHPLSRRLRINMGNLYYAKLDYSSAIRQYKIALDQTEKDERSVAHKIRRNIGNAYFKSGYIRDAVKSYEDAMSCAPDFQTGFNLLVCHLALGDLDSTKADFVRIVETPFKSELFDQDSNIFLSDTLCGTQSEMDGVKKCNNLDSYTKDADYFLLNAARLVAPSIDVNDWSAGYDWVRSVLQDRHESLAVQIELEQSTRWLKRKDFKTASKMLRALEKKLGETKAIACTNLSFISFLDGDVDAAAEYAEAALDIDQYNASALVNRGNCHFINKEYESAKECYLEAMGVQGDCAQAIFNLGLTNGMLKLPEEAVRSFEKIHRITPNNPSALYQIADIHDVSDNDEDAIKWFSVLTARVPTDATILARLGYLFSQNDSESQGLHYRMESFRHWPVDLGVIVSIGTWFVTKKMFEKSIFFFQQAAGHCCLSLLQGSWSPMHREELANISLDSKCTKICSKNFRKA
mmetsp:Transcript_23884/g.50785  ORF Transcript_23884/g.50785 Transcript_23884/m.50785 type:complete len:673 (-) Transcript_23884:1057-3075(-)